MPCTSMSTLGGVAMLASLLYFLRLIWRRKNQVSVKDKVVLITGASSGLGEACAHVFYRSGAKVILAARRLAELERVARDLKASKCAGQVYEPHVLALDLSNLEEIPIKARSALSIYGQIDILINNGGISYRGEVGRTDLSVDVQVMTVNYFGQVALTKALLPSMLARQDGHIVGVSSIQGKLAIPYRSPYSASKHAVQAFYDTLRAEVGDQNVRVSVVSPGYIHTNLSLNAVTADGSKYGVMDKNTQTGMRPEAVAARVLEAVVHGDNEVVLAPLFHRLAIVIRTLCPSLFFHLMFSRARKQRKEMQKSK